jgi:peroxin-14
MASSSAIDSAVAFLRDPAVQNAPLNKKLEFLQAKGLSQEDIDTAFRIATSSSSSNASSSTSNGIALPPRQGAFGYPGYHQLPNDRMRPDWRDWFIMVVVGGGVGTLMYSLAKVGLHLISFMRFIIADSQ